MIMYGVLTYNVKSRKSSLARLFYTPRDAVDEMDRLNDGVNRSAFAGKFYYFTDGLDAKVQDGKVYGLFKGKNFTMATELISLRFGFKDAHETANLYNAAADRPRMIDQDRFYVKMLEVK